MRNNLRYGLGKRLETCREKYFSAQLFLAQDKLHAVFDQLFKLILVFKDSPWKNGIVFFNMAIGEILQGFHTSFFEEFVDFFWREFQGNAKLATGNKDMTLDISRDGSKAIFIFAIEKMRIEKGERYKI